ncbi:hypothetical protein BCR42DRAFT_397710 [Absidia repens]|uniref:Uncharacterized protein n=1 Tax=Absidia repens TaxID=90262 RepID=A0A1X2I079_9FUNG|nr:hypothetical protein BCR42DRAFT_397710 [Absidia repens]
MFWRTAVAVHAYVQATSTGVSTILSVRGAITLFMYQRLLFLTFIVLGFVSSSAGQAAHGCDLQVPCTGKAASYCPTMCSNVKRLGYPNLYLCGKKVVPEGCTILGKESFNTCTGITKAACVDTLLKVEPGYLCTCLAGKSKCYQCKGY